MEKHQAMLKAIENYLNLIHLYYQFEDCIEEPPYEQLSEQLQRLKEKYREMYGVDPCSRCRCC